MDISENLKSWSTQTFRIAHNQGSPFLTIVYYFSQNLLRQSHVRSDNIEAQCTIRVGGMINPTEFFSLSKIYLATKIVMHMVRFNFMAIVCLMNCWCRVGCSRPWSCQRWICRSMYRSHGSHLKIFLRQYINKSNPIPTHVYYPKMCQVF